VIEQSDQPGEPDYALLRLDTMPAVTPTPLTTQVTDLLAVIQHPRGGLKVIAEGSFLDACNGQIYYVDLDTLVGSSGAGVLNRQGYVVGVHTDGDCTEDGGGTNFGWSAARIVEASPYLQDADIADR
jgi:V8-like Glu-specific endopeptidase